MKTHIFSLIFLLYSFIVAQEKFVNTNNNGDQREAVIGNTSIPVIVWTSEIQDSTTDIIMRFVDDDLIFQSEEIIVNDSTNGIQKYPQIAANDNFVIVWSSFNKSDNDNFYDIKGKLYSGSEELKDEFLINTYRLNSQTKPSVAMNSNNEFIVVWESWFQDGSDRGIYAQRFDENANKIGDEFRVNTTVEFSQCKPIVEYFPNGNFIIAWENWNEEELGYNLFAKIYDADGNVLKDEFMLNSYTENNQWYIDIETNNDGSFDAVWCSWEQDGYDGGIYLRSFNNEFSANDEEILINSSTEFYQWLPKIKRLENGNKIVIWSSWNIDGSREGVFYKVLDSNNKEISLETRVNENTESYQWEPDLLVTSSSKLLTVWSTWGEVNNDYEVKIKVFEPDYLIGKLNESTFQHSQGKSTSEFIVHILDSTKLTGHRYKININELSDELLSFSVDDETLGNSVTDVYPFTYESGIQYLTDEFDGVRVEFIPNFDLDIDFENSNFINNSGSNTSILVESPTINPDIAPVDLALIWGVPDTALSPNNIKEIETPFTAKNIETDSKIDILIFENGTTTNNMWDLGETIIFLTPEEYRDSEFSTHVQIQTSSNEQSVILPTIGDTNYIYTIKPLTTDDEYLFTTSKNNIILGVNSNSIPNEFKLYQNYPNPFNPTTTIKYLIPNVSTDISLKKVTLKVYDILGREVRTLVNKNQKSGSYLVTFNSSELSSGIYFYQLQVGKYSMIKKMLLLK